ncbi:MAG: glycosyltransferase family 4 protein [Chloroflexi bacterium]|nr:glycosyltransferase family 4 protein [Chloroflexota bacterium]MCI0577652.1 glycosyltransferase family 4 protein [Chloroflexota bacterium]MCI0644869.1 glycosyltransferase family 4 protein [Chloroflexota bacterium]MCI0725825.1 glycosyltransferase family 4 protein [Chloroflexota bacterium]
MRIAMVGPFGFHPNKTMRHRALPLARALVRRGHQVKLFMLPWQTPQEAGREWPEDGVAVRYVSLGGGVPGTAARLARETLAWRPEVVHTFKPKAYSGLVAWWLWRFHRDRLRLVTDTDDWEGWGGWNDRAAYTPLQKRFFAWQERWGLAHCHALTVASRALQTLAWAGRIPPERVVYLPNGPGIGTDTSAAPDKRAEMGLAGRPVLLLYSRLFEFDTGRLVDVLQRVQAAVPELAILAVGLSLFAADAATLSRRLAEAGLQEAVVEAGWVEESILPGVLAAADVGLYLMDDTLLNRTKCPVKLADMLAVGLPVVGEAVGQVTEYVRHQQTGLLYASGDTAGLAKGIVDLLTDPAERQRLAAGAREHLATHFNWDRLAERVMEAYEW